MHEAIRCKHFDLLTCALEQGIDPNLSFTNLLGIAITPLDLALGVDDTLMRKFIKKLKEFGGLISGGPFLIYQEKASADFHQMLETLTYLLAGVIPRYYAFSSANEKKLREKREYQLYYQQSIAWPDYASLSETVSFSNMDDFLNEVDMLIQINYFCINFSTDLLFTLLHATVLLNNYRLARMLIEDYHANTNIIFWDEQYKSISTKNIQLHKNPVFSILSLLSNDASHYLHQNPKTTPMHIAIINRSSKMLLLFLNSTLNSDVDAVDTSGFTPLLRAIKARALKMILILLDANANREVTITVDSGMQRTALDLLDRETDKLLLEILEPYFVSPKSTPSEQPMTPLWRTQHSLLQRIQFAEQSGDSQKAKRLRKKQHQLYGTDS